MNEIILPKDVVLASSVNGFKNALDNYNNILEYVF